MRYRKIKSTQTNVAPCLYYHPQFIYWTQNRIVKDALSKG